METSRELPNWVEILATSLEAHPQSGEALRQNIYESFDDVIAASNRQAYEDGVKFGSDVVIAAQKGGDAQIEVIKRQAVESFKATLPVAIRLTDGQLQDIRRQSGENEVWIPGVPLFALATYKGGRCQTCGGKRWVEIAPTHKTPTGVFVPGTGEICPDCSRVDGGDR